MEKYFGVYKPGNYWIYYNQDSSKNDSIYISDYEESQWSDMTICQKWDYRSYSINSEYLSADKILNTEYSSEGKCCITRVTITSSDRVVYLRAEEDTITSDDVIGINIKIITLHLWPNLPDTLHEVVEYNDATNRLIYIAPELGIVRFVAYDIQDTFSLVKRHIQ